MSSTIIRDAETEEGGGEVVNELGVDPTTDPELYMALQLSLQEERNRQAAAAAAQVRGGSSSQYLPSSHSIPNFLPAFELPA